MAFARVGSVLLLCFGLTVAVDVQDGNCNTTVETGESYQGEIYHRKLEFITSEDAKQRRPVVLECVDSDPTTRYRWFKNWTSLENAIFEADRVVMLPGKGTIVLLDPHSDDEGTYRCEAYLCSNGSEIVRAVYNIYVERLIAPSPFEATVGETIRVSPKIGDSTGYVREDETWKLQPVVWFKDGRRLVLPLPSNTNQSFVRMSHNTRDVTIEGVQRSDEGRYVCYTEDGRPLSITDVIVYESTSVGLHLSEIVVHVNSTVSFLCIANIDERLPLRFRWERDGSIIDFDYPATAAKYGRHRSWPAEEALIFSAAAQDAVVYSCIIDEGKRYNPTASLKLTVDDVPDAPQDIIVDCNGKRMKATVEWSPVEDLVRGNQSVSALRYEVQIVATIDSTTQTLPEISSTINSVEVPLSPWANYSFSVRAENNVGFSPVSDDVACQMPSDVPYNNPKDVRVFDSAPDSLSIAWEEMSPLHQNAPGFFYRVFYKRADVADAEWSSRDIAEWTTSQLVIDGQLTYRPYRVKVEAHNSLGKASVGAVEVDGFSGEGVPLTHIELPVLKSIVDANSAVISWQPVSAESFQGRPRGFKIVTWAGNDTDLSYIQEFVVEPGESEITVHNLEASAINYVQIRAINNKYGGPLSGTLAIVTPDGTPGPVASMEAVPIGVDGVTVSWTPPMSPNGRITSYRLSKQKFYGGTMLDQPDDDLLFPADTLSTNLTLLSVGASYRLSIVAETVAGVGEPYFVEVHPKNRPKMVFNLTVKADDRSRCIYYTVRYQKRGESSLSGIDVLATYGTATIANLESNIAYEIEANPYC